MELVAHHQLRETTNAKGSPSSPSTMNDLCTVKEQAPVRKQLKYWQTCNNELHATHPMCTMYKLVQQAARQRVSSKREGSWGNRIRVPGQMPRGRLCRESMDW